MGGFDQLLTHYDARLLLLAATVSFCGSVTAFRLYSRLRGSRGTVRLAWTVLTGLVAGSGAWATHFLALLAYDHGMTVGFAPATTMASLMVSVLFMSAGFSVASVGQRGARQVAGGAMIGMGLAAMHYTGALAMVTGGRMVWEQALVGASAVLGVAVSAGAVLAVGRCRKASEQLLGGVLMMAAIAVVHFPGMLGMSLEPDPAIEMTASALSPSAITFGVATIAALIIMGGLGAALIETSTTDSALRRIRRLADAAYEGIVVIREDCINDCNAAFSDLAGASADELRGLRLSGEMLTFRGGGAPGEGERREGVLHSLAGEAIPVEVAARLMDDGARQETEGLTVLTVRDLRERREAEEKIRYLADHDGLTGLPNRRAMQARLASALERVEASRESLAVLCVDLDSFKEANDLHGHQAGDALLMEISRRLQAAVQAPSFAARLGADEFVVVQVAGGDQPAAAAELAGQLLDRLRAPFAFEDQPLHAAGSIGISLFPHDGRTGEALLANADMALVRAKGDGGGGYCFFKREMDDSMRERRALVRELRHAISAGELVLHYQPLVRATNGHVCAFEALVRWDHPERGLVAPGAFIPLAEESGLIVPLGEWALRAACAEAAGWERPLRIAVNLSPLQLHQPDLAALVRSALDESGLPAERLELEITETALFHDYQRAMDNLWDLKALGVRVAMDDFGTGYSSLSTLQSFPFDKIKIDRSFVENIEADGRAKVIVRAILGLGRSLDIPVVAEGVETQAQVEFLCAEACAELQGFGLGRPSPAEAIAGWTSAAAQPIPLAPAPKRRSRAG